MKNWTIKLLAAIEGCRTSAIEGICNTRFLMNIDDILFWQIILQLKTHGVIRAIDGTIRSDDWKFDERAADEFKQRLVLCLLG